jgi:N-dimethylarginine dimethylaminohydrolase
MASAMQPSFLMCPPDFFDVHFLFNPHMPFTDRVDRRRARAQWRRLVRVLEEAGAQLEFLQPARDVGPLVFTADGAFCYRPGDVLILENDGVRGHLEPEIFRSWFRANGYRTESAPPGFRLDGGNLLPLANGDVVAGLKPGATGLGERYLRGLLRMTSGARLHTAPLVDERFLHLDMAVGVLADDRYLVYPGAFPGGEIPAGPLAEGEIIAVSSEDAARFACNIVVIGDVVVTGPVSDGLVKRIGRFGFHVERVDLGEFYKAGGGAKCLTLPLEPPRKGADHERPTEPHRRETPLRQALLAELQA